MAYALRGEIAECESSSHGFGGGIYVQGGAATLINLTVSANVANSNNYPVTGSSFGGGIGLAATARRCS